MALVFFLTAAVLIIPIADSQIVQTSSGQVQGQIKSTVSQSVSYYSFRGIPFAEPPINDLRFEPPVAKTPWNGVLDGTQDGSACVQGSDPVQGDEDCLFVNVYTPTIASNCDLLPTMVWFYGGGFDGGNNAYASVPPDFFLELDIVVVVPNYRLGIFGFLSTNDTVAPGNNGLKDQVLALQWVQQNIKNFCGNAFDVTIAGQSAGSASVSYHLQSPLSKGLFHKAIMESGVSLCLWALSRQTVETVKQIATDLGVSTSSSQSIINGLRQIDSVALQNQTASTTTSSYLNNNPLLGFALGPVIEPSNNRQFITGKSYELLASGQFTKVPVLIGFNSLEGSFDFSPIFRLFIIENFDRNPTALLPPANINLLHTLPAVAAIKAFYFNLITPVGLSNLTLMQFLTDDQFARGIREFAVQLQSTTPVYFYRFSYLGGLSGVPPDTYPGVQHSGELGYLFNLQYTASSSQDYVTRSRMVKLWTNFIKYGNPTPSADPDLQNIVWPTFDISNSYVDIGQDLVVTNNPEEKNMTFWDTFYSNFGNRPYDTY